MERLDHFHFSSLKKLFNSNGKIRFQIQRSEAEVQGMHTILKLAQLRWIDYVTRMPAERLLHVTDFNARNKCLTAKLLQQGYRYHKLRKTFSKFYRRHYELISKYNVGLKTLLSEGLSEPEFYGDLVYKLKKLKGINDFSLQFGKIITRYRRIGYNLNVMRQSACLVFNPITVDNYAAFFNCTPVGRASDSMMAPT